MSVLIQNKNTHVEYVTVINAQGVEDTLTVQPNGRVTAPRGWRVKDTGVSNGGLKITDNDKPVSPLVIKE